MIEISSLLPEIEDRELIKEALIIFNARIVRVKDKSLNKVIYEEINYNKYQNRSVYESKT